MNNYNNKKVSKTNHYTTTPPQGTSPQTTLIQDFFEDEEENKHKYTMYCMNCGKKGHLTKKCSHPIISLGILCLYIDNINCNINDIIGYSKKIQNNYMFEQEEYNEVNNIYESIKDIRYNDLDNYINYLMIRRKNSLSFVDFMRGKYDIDDYEYIHNTIHLMTEEEQNNLLTLTFDELWKDLWSCEEIQTHNTEYEESKIKFEKIKNGYLIQKNEIYLGSNHIRYKHIYYFSQINTKKELKLDMNNQHQRIEIGDLKWMTFHQGYNIIRDYNREKKNILYNVHLFLKDLIINFQKIYIEFKEKNKNIYV